MAREFGATDIVEQRGGDAIDSVPRLTSGAVVDAALECVGTDQSIATAIEVTRAGGMVGTVGFPTYTEFDYKNAFWRNVGIIGRCGAGPATHPGPAR